MTTIDLGVYEYAGFQYKVTQVDRSTFLAPIPGQHAAAGREKHLRAALECWFSDHPFRIEPCGCDYKGCKHWHIAPVADVQGVSFTQSQAIAVAELLNKRKQDGHDKEA